MTPTLDRKTYLERTFASAFKALDDVKSPAEREQIYAAIVAHVRSAMPMLLGAPSPVEPETHVRVDLGDGAAYDISVADGFLRLQLIDVTGDDTMHHFERKSAETFRDDFTRILASAGVR